MPATSPPQARAGLPAAGIRLRPGASGAPRASLLARAAHVLSGSLQLDEIVRGLAELVVPSLADWCMVDLLAEDGRPRHAAAAAADAVCDGALRELVGAHPHAAGPFADAVAQVLATGRPRLLERPADPAHAADDGGQLALLRALGRCSALVVPLEARGAVVGALVLARAGVRGPGPTDVAAAEELGALAGLAVHNATLYAQAQRAARMRDEVLGVVAHDLRNPLMAISMYAHVLHEGGLTPPQAEWVDVVLRNTERMNRLIQDLLDVSALEAGRLRVQPVPCAAGPLTAEALQLLEPQARAAGVRLSRVTSPVPPVRADRERVLQVLSNLLGNAVKFTPAGGAVELAVESRGAEVVFTVRDEGPGIAAEDVPRVFDRFWQGAGTRRGGAGLGLAIARGIVESHGGRIWVESVPGAGSTFSFTLPVSWAPAAVAAQDAPADEPVEAGAAVRVLLVDDHPSIRRGLRELLRHTPGLAVAGEAESADEAVARAAELSPDVVLMDLNLPGGGLDATRRILGTCPSTPVMILTAEPDDGSVRAALQAGARGYLRKSTDPVSLLGALRAVHRGERVLDTGLRGWVEEAADGESSGVSPRAVQVLTLSARGYGGPEIAARLGMRVREANQLRTRSMRALGLSTRAELVRHALREGWLGAGVGAPEPAGPSGKAPVRTP
jgi:signal transduction histidine kinase/DNA-binding NarL/FixJ family response regulator